MPQRYVQVLDCGCGLFHDIPKHTPMIPRCASVPKQDGDTILKAKPMLSVFSNPTEVLAILFNQTGSIKSKMAATKMEVLTSQLVEKIGNVFQRLNLCSRIHQSNGTTENSFPPNRK